MSLSSARVYDTYRSDYARGAFCSAIAGACSADMDLVNSFFTNPATLTAGPANWDFDGDYKKGSNLEPGMSDGNSVEEDAFSGGIGWSNREFGVGFGVFGRTTNVTSNVSVIDNEGESRVIPLSSHAFNLQLNLPISYRITPKWSFGITPSFRVYDQSITINGQSAKAESVRSSFKFVPVIGGFYNASSTFNFGTWFRFPYTQYYNLSFSTTALGTQLDYNEDIALHTPWMWTNGVSWRPWDDSRTFYLDVSLIGPTIGGYQLTYDTFATASGDRSIRQKGRTVSLETRLGFRQRLSFIPWFNPAFADHSTIHLGTYLEPARRQGYSPRIHGTVGLSYDFPKFLEFLGGLDVATDYLLLFFTFR